MSVTKPYSILFNAITDALGLMRKGKFEQAQAVLVKAQQETEDSFINKGEG